MTGQDLSAERREELFVKAADGCLSPAEERELEAHLEANPQERAELDDHHMIKEMTDAVVGRILADAHIEPPRPSAATKGAAAVGLFLLLAGVTILCGFALWSLFVASDISMVVKVGAALAAAGGVTLFALVLRRRLKARGRDPYQEIDR